jgi:hypothetical protein
MRNSILGALFAAFALPAAASDLARAPTYAITLTFPLGERSSGPRIAFSARNLELAVYDRRNLSCPPEGCPTGFLLSVGAIYAVGMWTLVRVLDKD